ncbi:protein fuzzy homolog [Stomoxys calcitrans]|uniref:protein fuzzy homolog n=1 Tax=Stomoxys calcitrans TaxID=35570 RepID=UPI0027E2D55E|nr:protein fuzzy homolog [Stomoxys calcitrans]
MSIYVICLTTNGGLPILTKRKGDCDNLPFSTIASLNGFHMFFKSLGITLHKTYADNWTYLWQDFNNIITVIVCATGIDSNTLDLLPEMIYGAFCLFISRDEMAHPSFIERLKKESKHYLAIIDAILEASISQFLGLSNCLLSKENSQILQRLNNDFSSQCGSLFCCLLVGQKRIAAGTDGWWDLHIVDRQLLLILLQTMSSLQNDIAVYLPKKSPNVAYRFITIPVSSNNVLSVICGTEPPLKSLLDLAEDVFRTESPTLQKLERYIPCDVSENIELDSGIIGIIIANTINQKCSYSLNIHHRASKKKFIGDFQSMDALRALFGQTLLNIKYLNSTTASGRECQVTHQHWSSDSHKFYAQKDEYNNIFCILFTSSIPKHAMKCIGKMLFAKILHEKAFCW